MSIPGLLSIFGKVIAALKLLSDGVLMRRVVKEWKTGRALLLVIRGWKICSGLSLYALTSCRFEELSQSVRVSILRCK